MGNLLKLKSFLRPYRRSAVLALMLLASLVILDLAIPRLVQHIIDQGIGRHDQSTVTRTGLIMLAISLVSMLFAIGNNYLSVRVGEGLARDMREALFVKIQSFSHGNLDSMRTGQLMVRLTSDTAALQRLTQMSLRIGTRAPLLMFGSLILMVNTSQSLALALSPLLIVTLAIIGFFVYRLEPLFRIVQQKFDRMNIVLQENISAARLIKAFVRFEYENRRFAGANAEFASRSTEAARFMAIMSPLLTVCINAGMIAIIWIGGIKSARGDLTTGQIVAFTNYLLSTMSPLLMMSRLANVWAGGIASAARISSILETQPEVAERSTVRAPAAVGEGRISFENVSFRYTGHQQKPVLSEIDLVVEPGETLAILGATGAGKTTLVNLIPRFYNPSSGRILIDGADIADMSFDELLALIAVVPQEAILFSGSVRDNIRYGRPSASDDEILSASRQAQAHDFICALPQQYDTHVEERGINLSGGQKQRITIARAILLKAPILILDDATSSVDADTENRIHEALDRQAIRQTRIVVAQRISTVLKADRIVVIEQGRIIAQGRHLDLLESSVAYQEIYDSQLGGGILPGCQAKEDQGACR